MDTKANMASHENGVALYTTYLPSSATPLQLNIEADAMSLEEKIPDLDTSIAVWH